ncbi:aminoglycoside phosphotransferase family protein [Streptomyces axinellae]|uniref:Aminoglycoside phosphotransferase family protein n=1 Tax=Streptomyces axinellae TaxID=552788 RepID=A0ABP6C8P1_9ACTN
MIVVPEAFAQGTIEREGEPGAAWLAELPLIVDQLSKRWARVPAGEVLHGRVGIIVPVRRRSGHADGPEEPQGTEPEGTGGAEDAAAGAEDVLKVSFPHPGNVHEPDAFTAWDGRGAVRLREREDARFAMLLERARTATLADVEDGDEVAAVAGRLHRRLAVPAPPGLPRLRDQADGWEERLREDARELPHGLSRGALGAARATVRELGRDQPDTLIHGDFHARNILRAEREPWLAIDPKGCAGDPAYDAGTLLTARGPVFLHLEAGELRKTVHRALDIFAEAAQLDRDRARRWTQLHAVQAAFWGRRHGFGRARDGAVLARLLQFAEHMAELLRDRARPAATT